MASPYLVVCIRPRTNAKNSAAEGDAAFYSVATIPLVYLPMVNSALIVLIMWTRADVLA